MRSQNITLSGRRSPEAAATSDAATALFVFALISDVDASLAIALRRRSRWPALVTPMSFSTGHRHRLAGPSRRRLPRRRRHIGRGQFQPTTSGRRSWRELFQQRLRVQQILGVEAFGEPAVYRGK